MSDYPKSCITRSNVLSHCLLRRHTKSPLLRRCISWSLVHGVMYHFIKEDEKDIIMACRKRLRDARAQYVASGIVIDLYQFTDDKRRHGRMGRRSMQPRSKEYHFMEDNVA